MEAIEDIKNNKTPKSSFDFLFIVEHPRLEKFYQNLRNAGNLIGVGDTTGIKATGDIIPIDAIPVRISDYDISWPLQIFEQGSFPDLSLIDIRNCLHIRHLPHFPTYGIAWAKWLYKKYTMKQEKEPRHRSLTRMSLTTICFLQRLLTEPWISLPFHCYYILTHSQCIFV